MLDLSVQDGETGWYSLLGEIRSAPGRTDRCKGTPWYQTQIPPERHCYSCIDISLLSVADKPFKEGLALSPHPTTAGGRGHLIYSPGVPKAQHTSLDSHYCWIDETFPGHLEAQSAADGSLWSH